MGNKRAVDNSRQAMGPRSNSTPSYKSRHMTVEATLVAFDNIRSIKMHWADRRSAQSSQWEQAVNFMPAANR